MGEDTRRIEDEIRAERHALDRNLETLESQAKALTDWRTHYDRHPGAALALAFSSGLLLSLSLGGSKPSYRPLAQPRQTRAGFNNVLKAIGEAPRARHEVSETWQNIVEAMVGLGAVKAVEWIGSVLPGFREEYDARHASARLSGTHRIQA